MYVFIVLRYTLYLIEKTRDNYPSGNLSISEYINEKLKVLMKCFKSCQHEMKFFVCIKNAKGSSLNHVDL